MKKLTFILALAILLGGGVIGAVSAPAHAQVYEYPPPPADPYAYPWVGPGTPWVYYNGDWFLNGILYFFFGPQYGWCPYYTYPPIYIVRPPNWYGPMWNAWYVARPQIWVTFQQTYPYWRGHREGQYYNRRFYEQHHRGQGAGWHEGFRGVKPERVPEGRQRAPSRVAPPGERRPAPSMVAPPEERKPAPSRVAPPEERKPAPSRVVPPEGQKPPPPRVTPPEGRKPAPSQVAPSTAPQPAPSRVAPPAAPKPGPAAPSAPKPEKGAPSPKPEKGGHVGEK